MTAEASYFVFHLNSNKPFHPHTRLFTAEDTVSPKLHCNPQPMVVIMVPENHLL